MKSEIKDKNFNEIEPEIKKLKWKISTETKDRIFQENIEIELENGQENINQVR
ncbi:10235_t:CDS:2 [Rhizophagus irregularis]|nr:10235_t:CDS:2 [Rhizophagus irregularis]